MKRITEYFKQSWAELRKVDWPSRSQGMRLTGAVIVFSVLFAGFIALLDTIFSNVLQKLILKG